MTSCPGSSPLARGLRAAPSDCGYSWGIIPARAGFTSPRRLGAPRTADHPRSRGVYRKEPMTTPKQYGSSPLARGLLRLNRKRLALAGIIPARAGFTLSGSSSDWRRGDHPRSRGVYID